MVFFRLALLFFCSLTCCRLWAQAPALASKIDSLRYLSTDERIVSTNKIMLIIREKVAAPETEAYVNQIAEILKEVKDDRAISNAMLQKGIWLNVTIHRQADAIAYLIQAVKYTEDHTCPNEKAAILVELAIQHADLGDTDKALSYFLQTVDFLKENNYQLEYTAEHLVYIGDFYYRMGYYTKAAEFFTRYAENTRTVLKGWHMGNCLNTGGLTFQKLKQYNKAIYYFNQALEINIHDKNAAWIGLLKGNIGSVYFEMGDFGKAVPLLEEAVTLGKETKLYHSAAFALQFLAKIAFQKGDLKKALNYYNEALEINARENSLEPDKRPVLGTERDIREGLFEFYQKTGNNEKALASYQRFTLLKDSLMKLNRAEEVKKLEMKHEFERQGQQIAAD